MNFNKLIDEFLVIDLRVKSKRWSSRLGTRALLKLDSFDKSSKKKEEELLSRDQGPRTFTTWRGERP